MDHKRLHTAEFAPSARRLPSYARGDPAGVKSGRPDLNRRPHRPERCALPGCATPRDRSHASGALIGKHSWGARRRPRPSPWRERWILHRIDMAPRRSLGRDASGRFCIAWMHDPPLITSRGASGRFCIAWMHDPPRTAVGDRRRSWGTADGRWGNRRRPLGNRRRPLALADGRWRSPTAVGAPPTAGGEPPTAVAADDPRSLHLRPSGTRDGRDRGLHLCHRRLALELPGLPRRPRDDDRRLGREPEIDRKLRVRLDPALDLGGAPRALPGVEVEVRDRVADVLQELVRDGSLRRGLLVSEEELDVLPLPVLLAGRGGCVGGRGGLGLSQREVSELQARSAGARVLLDQLIHRPELVVGAARTLQVVEHGDRHFGVSGPEIRAVLGDPGDELLDPLGAGDLDLLRAALADRDRDDRGEQTDHAGGEQHARHPGAPDGHTRKTEGESGVWPMPFSPPPRLPFTDPGPCRSPAPALAVHPATAL